MKKHSEMAKRKRMDQIKAIIHNYLESGSIKATARRLKISKNTVREYLRRARESTTDISTLLSLDAEALRNVMYEAESLDADQRVAIFQSKVEYWLKELGRVGVTRQLLWNEYRKDHPDGFGYSQFCERLRQEIGRRDLTLSLQHTPGEVLMVDFCREQVALGGHTHRRDSLLRSPGGCLSVLSLLLLPRPAFSATRGLHSWLESSVALLRHVAVYYPVR